MTYRGTVKDGQILLDEALTLPEGTVVTVDVVEGWERPTIWDKLLELAGTAKGLPPDAARNHDHYLYGAPKRK
jgi:hypothetical protein